MIKRIAIFSFIIGISYFLLSCSTPEPSVTKKQPKQSEYYTTSFPTRDVAKQLTNARESILRILVSTYYNTYNFGDRYITLADIKTNKPKDIASEYFSSEQSTAGTSIILQYNHGDALLITCNHVVSSADTLITYYEGDTIPKNTFIKSISIKQRQNNLIFSPSNLQNFKVIASDEQADLALLTTSLNDNIDSNRHPLTFTAGNNDLLQIGSFLYVIGFPKGFPMITRAIASNSEPRNNRFFISDAIFNPGISGGLIFASKDNFHSFQWVGMARSATASSEDVLVPKPNTEEKYGKIRRPYRDSIFVQQKTRISYGITQAIPINRIKNFINENKKAILRNGFSYIPK